MMLDALVFAWKRFTKRIPPEPPQQESLRLLGHDSQDRIWFQLGMFHSEEALRLEAIATLTWMRERGILDRLYIQKPDGSLEGIWRFETIVVKEA